MAVKGEKKGHHFVPQTYLRKFGYQKEENKYFVSAFDKKDNLYKGELPINRIGKKKNFYKLKGKTKEERELLENYYGKFTENDYSRLYELLINRRNLTISDYDRKSIIFITLTLYFRNYFWFDSIKEFFNGIIKDSYDLIKNKKNKTVYSNDGSELFSFNKKDVNEVLRNDNEETREILINTQLRKTLNLFKIRQDDVVGIFQINSSLEFISSDNPVIWLAYEPIIRLPLDPKHYLLLYKTSEEINRKIIFRRDLINEKDDAEIVDYNRMQFENAYRFIVGNKKEILKLNKDER